MKNQFTQFAQLARWAVIPCLVLTLVAPKSATAGSPPAVDPLAELEDLLKSGGDDNIPFPGANNPQGRNPSAVNNPAAPAVAKKAPQVSIVKNEITNIDFKMEGDNSRITLTARHPLVYQEVKNDKLKQYVYLFENTFTTQGLQRAYDTSEFRTPIGLFTLLQRPSKNKLTTKLIVQLREDKKPLITTNEKGMTIEFPPADGDYSSREIAEERNAAIEENIYSGDKIFTGTPIRRLEVKNSDIQDVLRFIAKSSGYNIVIGEDVKGNVGTFSLENTPWDQAFALVLQSKKLSYIRQGNVLRVGTLASLSAEKAEAFAQEEAKLKIEPLRTVLIPISYAKATDLKARAEKLLTPNRGNVDVDDRSNTLIIRDVDAVITRVQKLLNALDNQPPLVSISAKIVEMQSSFSRNLGVSLLQLSGSTSGLDLGIPPVSSGISAGTPGFNFATGSGTVNISAANFAKLNATLSFGETENAVKLLANPTISVQQGQSGTITQGSTNYVATPGGNGVPGGLQAITANLTLNVTPIVAGDGSISMNVSVTNQIPKVTNSASGSFTAVDTRQVTTQVLLQNGDTAVVGGVFKDQRTDTSSGVPWLRKLPVIGALFSSESTIDERNEVVIFLTARLLNADETFKRNL